MSNAIKDFLEYDDAITKEGAAPAGLRAMGQKALGAFTSSLGTAAGQLGAGALISAGAYGASRAIQAASSAINRSRGYKKMMEIHPDLADRDDAQVKGMYNLLHKSAPTLAMNPYVAGGFIRRTEHASQYVDPKMVSDLAQAEATIQRSSMGGFAMPMEMTAKMIGSMPGAKLDE